MCWPGLNRLVLLEPSPSRMHAVLLVYEVVMQNHKYR